MDTDAISQLLQFGIAGIFAILMFKLYQDERRAHLDTIQKHLEDLRDIAGIRQELTRTQGYVASWRDSEDKKNTVPLVKDGVPGKG